MLAGVGLALLGVAGVLFAVVTGPAGVAYAATVLGLALWNLVSSTISRLQSDWSLALAVLLDCVPVIGTALILALSWGTGVSAGLIVGCTLR